MPDWVIMLILTIISIIVAIIYFTKGYQLKKEITEKLNKEKKEFQEEWIKEAKDKYAFELARLEVNLNSQKQENDRLDKEILEKRKFNLSLQKIREDELNRLMEEKRQRREIEIQYEIDEWTQSAQEAATFQQSLILNKLQKELDEKCDELHELQIEVNEYKAKRRAINEEILRARAVEQKQDFYRIQLSQGAWEDINYLLSIIERFNHKEIIYKLIWTEYLQAPFKEMCNRVLAGKNPRNVIYIIQNIDTQEIYIGKTQAEISKRWTDHIKTSLNIGSVSGAKFHKAIYNNWDRFTFSILEEVPQTENLNEREKYYINFYQSNVYGYNIKAGG